MIRILCILFNYNNNNIYCYCVKEMGGGREIVPATEEGFIHHYCLYFFSIENFLIFSMYKLYEKLRKINLINRNSLYTLSRHILYCTHTHTHTHLYSCRYRTYV